MVSLQAVKTKEELVAFLKEQYVPKKQVDKALSKLSEDATLDSLVDSLAEDGQKFHVFSEKLTGRGKKRAQEVITLEPAYDPGVKPFKLLPISQVYVNSNVYNEDAWESIFEVIRQEKPDAIHLSNLFMRIDRPEYFRTDEKVRLSHFDLTTDQLSGIIRGNYAEEAEDIIKKLEGFGITDEEKLKELVNLSKYNEAEKELKHYSKELEIDIDDLASIVTLNSSVEELDEDNELFSMINKLNEDRLPVTFEDLKILAKTYLDNEPRQKLNEYAEKLDLEPEKLIEIVELAYVEAYDPLASKMEREKELGKEFFKRLREAAGDDAKIVYLMGMDDGYTANRIAHKNAISHRDKLNIEAKTWNDKTKVLDKAAKGLNELDDATKELKKLSYVQEETKIEAKTKKEIDKVTKKIEKLESKIKGLLTSSFKDEFTSTSDMEAFIQEKYVDVGIQLSKIEKEAKYFRPRKESPLHQTISGDAAREIIALYHEMGDEFGVELKAGQYDLDVNGTVFEMADNARIYDASVKNMIGTLVKEVSDKARRMHKKGKRGKIVGHNGRAEVYVTRTAPTVEAFNKELLGKMTVDPKHYGESEYAIVLPMTVDKTVLAEMIKGNEPERLTARKPSSNRMHDLIRQFNNRGVSGIMMLTGDELGRLIPTMIDYKSLKNKKAKVRPKRFGRVTFDTDAHSGSPGSRPELLEGAHYKRSFNSTLENELDGVPVFEACQFEGGDKCEGNTAGWPSASSEFDGQEIDQANSYAMRLILNPPKDLDEIVAILNEAPEGVLGFANSNLGKIMKRSAAEFRKDLDRLLKESPMKTIMAIVGGNHFFHSVDKQGLKEYESFETILDVLGMKKNDRVHLDLSHSRSNAIEFYIGEGKNGEKIFGGENGFKVVLMHDPKFKGTPANTAAGYQLAPDADLKICGHYHSTGYKWQEKESELNTAVPGVAGGCFQLMTSTETFKGGLRRTLGNVEIFFAEGHDEMSETKITDNSPQLLRHRFDMGRRLETKKAVYVGEDPFGKGPYQTIKAIMENPLDSIETKP